MTDAETLVNALCHLDYWFTYKNCHCITTFAKYYCRILTINSNVVLCPFDWQLTYNVHKSWLNVHYTVYCTDLSVHKTYQAIVNLWIQAIINFLLTCLFLYSCNIWCKKCNQFVSSYFYTWAKCHNSPHCFLAVGVLLAYCTLHSTAPLCISGQHLAQWPLRQDPMDFPFSPIYMCLLSCLPHTAAW